MTITANSGIYAGNPNITKIIGRFTVSALPAASAVPAGGVAYITGLLTGRDVLMQSDGSYWRPYGGDQLLYIGSGDVTMTGVAAEAIMDQFTLPAKLMAPRTEIRVEAIASSTNSTNSKRQRIRLGGLGGTAFSDLNFTSATNYGSSIAVPIKIGATLGAQTGLSSGLFTAPFGNSTAAFVAGTVDLTSDTVVCFTGQVAAAGETIVLKHFAVRLRG